MAQTRTLKVTLTDASVLVSVLQQIHLNPNSDVSKVIVEKKEPETEVLMHVRGGSANLLAEILALDGVRIANLL